MIKARNTLKGKLNTSIVREYPELENLEVMPSIEEQNFKSNKYGYDEVTVKGVTADIDANIQPEYIKEGVSILGVNGGYKGVDTSDATAVSEDVLQDKTFYANNQKFVGAMQEYDGSYSGNTSEPVVITDASYLFYNGARLDIMEEFLKMCDNVTSLISMFNGASDLTEIDLSNFKTINLTTVYGMFRGCKKLINANLSNFDVDNISNMNDMFYNCSELTNVNFEGWDKSSQREMYNTFAYCSSLENLDLSTLNASNVIKLDYCFQNCSKLKKMKLFKNLGKGYTQKSNNHSSYKLDLSYSTNLSYDSLMDVINNLYDLNLTYNVVNGGTLYTQKLTLGETNISKLTAEEIAIATNKGWTVS